MRADLGPANAAVQVAHAVLEAVRFGVVDPATTVHPNFVLLAVPDRPALLAAADRVARAGVRFHAWSDSLFPGGPTALCTEPLAGDRRRPLRRYLLFEVPTCPKS